MIVVIFAGGKGTRLLEETKNVPKPMVKIGKFPIIEHIIRTYAKYNFNKFILLTGYKANFFNYYFRNKKNFFLDKNNLSSKVVINKFNNSKIKNKIYIKNLFTGINTNKKNRLLKAKKYLMNSSFFLTYGDGLSDINFSKLLKKHKKSKQICTLTAVNPPQRFGVISISKNNIVKNFSEKKSIKTEYISGGFFVCEPTIFKFLKKNEKDFEEDVLPILAKKRKLLAYIHKGFWYSMDTLRDKIFLTKLYNKNAPWK